MKSIGYVLADFPVLSETFVGDEMRAVRRRGHSVTPIVMRPGAGPAQQDDIDLAHSARHLQKATWREALHGALRPAMTAVRALTFARRQTRLPIRSLLWNALKICRLARHCDHLHAHFSGGAAAHAIVAARWMGASVSFVCHGHDVYAEPEDLQLKLEEADAVVAVCEEMAADLRAVAPRARIVVNHCGVDVAAFVPDDAEPNGRLLFIGRLVEQKGVDDLLDALSQCEKNVALDIVGAGPLADQLKAKTLSLCDRVRFLGARSREWIAREAPRYSGLVAPFKAARDGARDSGPLVVKEAMAMGLPVVATAFMGLKEMVTPETGTLVAVGDKAALARALTTISQLDPHGRAAMGRAARARAQALYTSDGQAARLSRLFEAL